MNLKNTRRTLTDTDRDQVLKLMTCGLGTKEIADIMHVSPSAVTYIRQAHNAGITQDWSALQKLSITHRSAVEWALKVTGADKSFAEFEKTPVATDEPEVTPAPPVETITREDFLTLTNALQDIVYLLTEIRDTLK